MSIKNTEYELELIASTIGSSMRKNLPAIALQNEGIYIGQWKNGKRDGKGIMTWPDKSSFEGNFKEDEVSGFGKIVHSNGDIYEGEWDKNKANGFGVFTYANGQINQGFLHNYFFYLINK